DRRQTCGTVGPGGDLESDARFGERPLRPDDPLGDARDGDEEPSRDLLRRQTPKHAEGESDASIPREHRMAGHEDETEEIITDVLVDRLIHFAAALSALDIATDLVMLALERLATADHVDRPMLRGAHQPGARSLWNARHR